MFGPRLLGVVGYFLAARVSRRQLQEMLREVFGIPVSLGALSQAEERISEAIAGPTDAAAAYVRGQPVKHVDGSTWRLAGSYAALWTIATKFVVTFFDLANAKTDTIAALLGTLKGIMVTDRGSQFGFWAMVRRQIIAKRIPGIYSIDGRKSARIYVEAGRPRHCGVIGRITRCWRRGCVGRASGFRRGTSPLEGRRARRRLGPGAVDLIDEWDDRDDGVRPELRDP